jgi:hypothetical protein
VLYVLDYWYVYFWYWFTCIFKLTLSYVHATFIAGCILRVLRFEIANRSTLNRLRWLNTATKCDHSLVRFLLGWCLCISLTRYQFWSWSWLILHPTWCLPINLAYWLAPHVEFLNLALFRSTLDKWFILLSGCRGAWIEFAYWLMATIERHSELLLLSHRWCVELHWAFIWWFCWFYILLYNTLEIWTSCE